MAKPIKETPVLTGCEAMKFATRIDNPRPVSQQEIAEARHDYDAVMSIAQFNF